MQVVPKGLHTVTVLSPLVIAIMSSLLPSVQPSPPEQPAQRVFPPLHPQGVPVRPGHDRDGPEQSL